VSEDRTAIVTGAARGIGAAIAQRLAKEGKAVAVLDLDQANSEAAAKAIVADGGRAIGVGADVSDAEMVAAAVERVAAELGPPTILAHQEKHFAGEKPIVFIRNY